MRATEQHLIDMVNACLSPIQPLRDDAIVMLHHSGLSFELIANLRWANIRYLEAGGLPMIATRHADIIQVSPVVAAPLLAWKTVSAERGWCDSCSQPVFIPFDDGTPVTDRLAAPDELAADVLLHPVGEPAIPNAQDIRDAAMIAYAYFTGRPPNDLASLRWRDLPRSVAHRYEHNLRLSTPHRIDEWWDCWNNIIGRRPRKEDAVWISTDRTELVIGGTGQVLPLDKRSYWAVFSKRATQAGHPQIAADSFTRQRHH